VCLSGHDLSVGLGERLDKWFFGGPISPDLPPDVIRQRRQRRAVFQGFLLALAVFVVVTIATGHASFWNDPILWVIAVTGAIWNVATLQRKRKKPPSN
jgi:hypothetical protein